jgi:hypothetical protein
LLARSSASQGHAPTKALEISEGDIFLKLSANVWCVVGNGTEFPEYDKINPASL